MVGLKGLKQFRTLAGNFSRVFFIRRERASNDRRTAVYLFNCIHTFNQQKRSERFRKILHFISLRVFFLVKINKMAVSML